MSRCVETGPVTGQQCELEDGHADRHKNQGNWWVSTKNVCAKWVGVPTSPRSPRCARDVGHLGECRPQGWLAPAVTPTPLELISRIDDMVGRPPTTHLVERAGNFVHFDPETGELVLPHSNQSARERQAFKAPLESKREHEHADAWMSGFTLGWCLANLFAALACVGWLANERRPAPAKDHYSYIEVD